MTLKALSGRPDIVLTADDATGALHLASQTSTGGLASLAEITVKSASDIIEADVTALVSGIAGAKTLADLWTLLGTPAKEDGNLADLKAAAEATLAAINSLAASLGSLEAVTGAGPRVLTAPESRMTFTNEGTSAKVGFTLPAAAAGLVFTFIVQDADGIRVTAAAGDTIRVAGEVSIAAGYIESTTIGSTMTLMAINATEWLVVPAYLGTWTLETS